MLSLRTEPGLWTNVLSSVRVGTTCSTLTRFWSLTACILGKPSGSDQQVGQVSALVGAGQKSFKVPEHLPAVIIMDSTVVLFCYWCYKLRKVQKDVNESKPAGASRSPSLLESAAVTGRTLPIASSLKTEAWHHPPASPTCNTWTKGVSNLGFM